MVFRAGHPDLGISPKSTAASLELDVDARNNSGGGGDPSNDSLSVVDTRFPRNMNTGETAQVEIDIRNNGSSEEKIDVEWDAIQRSGNGLYTVIRQITVPNGQTQTVSFDFTPASDEAGTWEHTLSALGGDRTGTTMVSKSTSFNIEDVTINAAQIGKPLDTDVTIKNTGSMTDDVNVKFEISSYMRRTVVYEAMQTVSLAPGETKVVIFDGYVPSIGGLYGVKAIADNDSQGGPITVLP
jgi:uncharacterized membrane protein